jgi:site-specific recombinase XerD
LPALPAAPETVYLYLSALVADDNAAGYAVSTLDRRLAAIGWVHESSSHDNPCRHARIRQLTSGIRRTHGNPPLKRDPLSTEQLGAMLEALDIATLTGKRDRALLLVGYAGAFRRSELVGLTVGQLARRGDRGYVVRLVRTKDDQQRRGRDVGIPRFAGSTLCPVAALDTWLTAAEITAGPVFRRVTRYQTVGSKPLSAAAVAAVVKRAAAAAGISPHLLAGHSLRAGHATVASENGAPDRTIMRQTGHKHLETLDGYIRSANLLRDNSARYLALDAPEDAREQ